MSGLGSSKAKGPSASDSTTALGEYQDPLASLVHNNGTTYYQPNGQTGLNSAVTNYGNTVNNAVNGMYHYDYNPTNAASSSNPFYQSAYQLLTQPINNQYQQNSTALQNNLNAGNQLGSSYDALQHYYLNQNYNQQLQNANAQAVAQGVNDYTGLSGAQANNLNTLTGAGSNLYNQYYDPLQQLAALRGQTGQYAGQGLAANTQLANNQNQQSAALFAAAAAA